GAVALLAVLGVDPDADVDLTVDQLAEHHADLLPGIDGDKPGSFFIIDASQRRLDLIVDSAGRPPGSVARRAHFLGPRGKDVAVLGGGEGAQLQALTGTGRTFGQREAQLLVEVVELGDDLLARVLGELLEGHAHHRLGGQVGRTQQCHNRLDRSGLVLGFHDGVGNLMPTFECGEQGICDFATGCGVVVVCHGISVERRRGNCATRIPIRLAHPRRDSPRPRGHPRTVTNHLGGQWL
ncbi:hypothetical protein NJB1728f10_27340, partial [Mycobacterium marinum]